MTGLRVDVGRHAHQAIGVRPRLAHQHVALFLLQPRQAGGVLPAYIDVAADDPGAACTACPGCAFVRKGEPLAQTSLENRLPVPHSKANSQFLL